MKRFNTHNLGYALQIFAVVLLFGYPGCSLMKGQKGMHTDKKTRIEKDLTPAAVGKTDDSLTLLKQWATQSTPYPSFIGARK